LAGADILLSLAHMDGHRLSRWTDWGELQKIVAEALTLTVAMTAGDQIYKEGYQALRSARGLSPLAVPNPRMLSVAGLSSRVFPLWFAFAGAPVVRGEGFHPLAAALGIAPVMAVSGTVHGVYKGVKLASTVLRVGRMTLTAAEIQAAAPPILPNIFCWERSIWRFWKA